MRAQTVEVTKLVMAVIVSLGVFGVSLFIIGTETYSERYAEWAFGAIGLVLGYWLR